MASGQQAEVVPMLSKDWQEIPLIWVEVADLHNFVAVG
jgi:hypothetical protein